MMQTLSDPFLGFTGFGGHDYLVRQLADHKAALDPAELDRKRFMNMLSSAAKFWRRATPGRATRRSSLVMRATRRSSIRALTAFAVTYAEQVRADYRLFRRSPHSKSPARAS